MSRHFLLALLAFAIGLQIVLALPLAAEYSSSVFIGGDKFYIQGGRIQNGTSTESTTQFFYIDLSSSWQTSSPTFKIITSTGGPITSSSPVTLNKDNTSMIIFASSSIYTYSFQTTLWSSFNASSFLANRFSGAATDPHTGYIYFPQGHVDGGMLQYDPATQAAVSIQMPSEIQASNTTGPYLAATIWNGIRNTVITAGTPITTNPNFVLYEYSATTGWTVIVQQGNIPIADDAYCLVPAYGGTKLVYFGGTHLGFYNTNVYMFDIATNTWTLMASQISQSARVGMQCAASGDMFVVWGGGPVRDSLASPTPLVYNMKSQMWQVTFEAPTSTNTSTPTSTSTSTSPSASTSASASTSKGPIIGGVVGGLFVIGLIAGAFVYRRRRSNRNKEYTVTEGTSVSVGGERKPSDDMNGRPRSFAIGQKQGDASGMHPNPYISYPKPPGSQYMSENTSGVPLRGPQVYSSDQSGPQVWSQRLERNPQEGYQTGFQDPL